MSRLPDYYALLQISPKSAQIDITHAYRQAKLAYQESSMAAYSLFSADELEEIQAQIEEAYYTLSHPEKRRSYDLLYRQSGYGGKSASFEASGNVIPLMAHASADSHTAAPESRPVHAVSQLSGYSGEALRQIREEKQIPLEAIADHTKISMRYLRAIEEESAERFPEEVYLKGYLKQYCAEIGVEAEPVVRYFLTLIDSSQE